MGQARRHNHNRRHSGGKVHRKLNSRKLKRIFSDNKVAKVWNLKAGLKSNYRKLGVTHDPERVLRVIDHSLGRLQDSLGVKVSWVDLEEVAEDVKTAIEASKRNPARPSGALRSTDKKYLKRLIEKYGEDIARMVKDTKVNYNQWSKEQIEAKMGELRKYNEVHHGQSTLTITPGATGTTEATETTETAAKATKTVKTKKAESK